MIFHIAVQRYPLHIDESEIVLNIAVQVNHVERKGAHMYFT